MTHEASLHPVLSLLLAAALIVLPAGAGPAAGQGALNNAIYLPLLLRDGSPPPPASCRLGIGAGQDVAAYPVNDLGAGWYVDWGATAYPSRPGGMEYAPTIRLRQTGPASYTIVSPSPAALTTTVRARPGTTWLLGNEPDSIYQDKIEPRVYARAYHDLYRQIKALAPDAQIVAGNIVQPTPLRLQYLDQVLDSYRTAYGETMPVDGWAIHTYALQERSCSVYPENCWGAEIPPGIGAGEGALYTIADSANAEIMKQLVTDFRRWMADRGYRDRPLLLPEWGVLMWPVYISAEQVNAYMDATFSWITTATDAATGYPPDDDRLVQRAAWYSLTDTTYNGWLYESGQVGGSTVITRTIYGDNFIRNSGSIPQTVNFTPVDVTGGAQSPPTMTLTARVANNGNARSAGFAVRFYDGPPEKGDQIGEVAAPRGAPGCATPLVPVSLDWSAPPGPHMVYAVVDPGAGVQETDSSDNVVSGMVVAPGGAPHALYLPALARSGGP